MEFQRLESQLRSILTDYKNKSNEICASVNDPECKEAIRKLSDNVGHCFADLAKAITDTMRNL